MRVIPTFSHAAMSLWQSAINAVVVKHDGASATQLSAHHDLMKQAVAAGAAAVPSGAAPAALTPCPVDEGAHLATKLALALFRGNGDEIEAIRREFAYSRHDPLWVECLAEYEKSLLLREHVPYRTYDLARIASDFVLSLPEPAHEDLVIAVIGDWGTGTHDAQQLLAAAAAHKPDLLIHLGDIYYSGTATECTNHFYAVVMAQWPGESGPAIPVYTLAGNHDLYSGGAGYYQLLDRLGQPASFFCLRNEYWQLLGLDTGLHEHDVSTADSCLTYLEPTEALWHQDKLLHAGARKTILLSHHQLFSAVGGGVGQDSKGRSLAVNPNLYGAFSQNGVSLQAVALWLWGHEHNLVVYEPYAGLARGRCLGAGAIPVDTSENPYAPNPDLLPLPGTTALPQFLANVRLDHDDDVYNRCYAVLTLSGTHATAAYYQFLIDADAGQLLYSEEID